MHKCETLIGEIAKRGINYNDIAAKLGISRDTLRNKLMGKTRFTVDEAVKIRREFFSNDDKLSLDVLFDADKVS